MEEEPIPPSITPIKWVPTGKTARAKGLALRGLAEEELNILLDTGSEIDLISMDLVRRLRLKPATDYAAPGLESFRGDKTNPGNAYWFTFFLIDNGGNPRKVRRVFAGSDTGSGRHDVILSYRSMGQEGIVIDCAVDSWYYREIALADPESLLRDIVENRETAYVLHIAATLSLEERSMATLGELSDTGREDENEFPPELEGLEGFFDEDAAKGMPLLPEASHRIDLVEGSKPPYGPLYPMNEAQYGTLREYLAENLANGRIEHSVSEAGAPILFVPKKDGGMRLCVDYRGLNKVTIKNRYPLPLIGDLLDRLAGAKWISKIDIRDAYHRIRVAEEDRWKTAFRTRYGHFQYTVMPFGLTNAPATFQAYIHRSLADMLDTCCISYMDDILVYSQTREEHTKHLREVLRRLAEAQLYGKLSKCEFYQQSVEFLGYIITQEGVKMDPIRVKSISEWEAPTSFRDIQVFLGFCNFYRKFIAHYSAIVSPITSLLKGSKNGKKSGEFTWTSEAEQAFQQLKHAFCSATILRHWDPSLPTRVETDASARAISGILTQLVDTQWRPIAYWSRKLQDQEQRWATGQQELLAIIESLEHWAHYLQGLSEKFLILTDHQALTGVVEASAKDLRGRLARWVYRLSAFDFDIKHRPGTKNPADGLSRRPDYMKGEISYEDVLPTLAKKLELTYELPEPTQRRIAALEGKTSISSTYVCAVRAMMRGPPPSCEHEPKSTTHYTISAVMTRRQRAKTERADAPRTAEQVEDSRRASGDLTPAGVTVPEQYIPRPVMRELMEGETALLSQPSKKFETLVKELQSQDQQCQHFTAKARGTAGERKGYTIDSQDLLRYKGRLVIPDQGAMRTEILRRHHDDPRAGHMGSQKTLDLISRKFHWQGIAEDVREYVESCPTCQGIRVPRHRPYGKLQSLPLPSHPFQEISLDFITGLPPSTRSDGGNYDAILVIVCRMTKFALFIPTTKKLRATELAALLYEHVESRFGTPEGIVSDRDKLITSKFWADLMKERAIRRRLSTAYHPQTDGQTERTHQTLEKYLRAYAGDSPERWAIQLLDAAFAYNNSKHSTIGVSPMEALFGYHPRCVEYVPTKMETNVQGVAERLTMLGRVRTQARVHWEKASESQAKHYDSRHKPQTYHRGQIVGVSTKNWRFKYPKLAPRFMRAKVLDKYGEQAYALELPEKYQRIHNVFHVSLIEPWNDRRAIGDTTQEQPELEDEPDEWEVEEVVSHKDVGDETFYLIKWKGWPVEYNTWEPKEHLENAQAMVRKYLKVARKDHKKWDEA